jgi:hypothetical protein
MPDKTTIREELEALQLEESRQIAEDRRMARAQKANRSRAIELSLKRDKANQERIQAACVHRKGGKGVQQLYQGNDANYALITHTLSHGVTIIVCQRCGKLWEPSAALPKNAKPEQRVQYRADLAEYRRVLNLPTDNEPSGTTLFAFSQPEEDAA